MALHLLVVDDLMRQALRRDRIIRDYTHERHYKDDTLYQKYMFPKMKMIGYPMILTGLMTD